MTDKIVHYQKRYTKAMTSCHSDIVLLQDTKKTFKKLDRNEILSRLASEHLSGYRENLYFYISEADTLHVWKRKHTTLIYRILIPAHEQKELRELYLDNYP